MTANGVVRVSVHGPTGEADLAVPLSTTVADLLPVLLKHTGVDEDDPEAAAVPERGWVLQRLGQPPMDPEGTPETLDWMEGDRLHLRPDDSVLPSLDFDDIADGMAGSVSRQGDRWRPEYTRLLMLGVAAVVLVAVVAVLVIAGGQPATPWLGAGFTLVGVVAVVVTARRRQDRALVGLLAAAIPVFTGTSAVLAVDSALRSPPSAWAAVAAGVAVAVVSALLLAVRATVVRGVPFLLFATTCALGVVLAGCAYLRVSTGLPVVEIAAVATVVVLAGTAAAPRLVLRLARLHGPQLPRSADELQHDIAPLPADEVAARTSRADRVLTVLAITTAAVDVVAAALLTAEPDWARITLAVLFTALLCTRARVHLTVAQRLALVVAACANAVLLTTTAAREVALPGRLVLLGGLVVLWALCATAALRPPTRRPRPVWAQAVLVLETVVAVALVPILLQVLGVYAWARGLAG